LKRWIGFGPVALLLALMLALASCGGSAGSGSGPANGSGNSNGDMEGMDHGGSGDSQATSEEESTGGMSGMDHGDMDMGSGAMAAEMVMENGEYSDERFIDSMVPHHRGAVEMAEVALDNAEHEEIKGLAEDIVRTQEAEIERLRSIKEEAFGTSEVPMEMDSEEMEMMGMTDPQELAGERPFDRAFIDAMIPHHESAIDMANVALQESDNPDIRQIAEAIVDAQKREIAQMRGWREEWYPNG
jgi:uncharacterized protein (DUF305 family)